MRVMHTRLIRSRAHPRMHAARASFVAVLLLCGAILTGCDGVPGWAGADDSEAGVAAESMEAQGEEDVDEDDASASDEQSASDDGTLEDSTQDDTSQDRRTEADDGAAPPADADGASEDGDARVEAAASDEDGGSAREPGPADPLTASEAARARALALEAESATGVVANALDRDAVLTASTDTSLDAEGPEERVRAMAEQPSYRILYSQRYPSKDPDERAAEVAMYRYDTGEAVFSKVDLATGRVSALDFPADAPVPLVPEEIEEAAIAARADGGVRARMEAADLDPDTASANALLTGTDDASSPCAEHRCVRLFFSNIRRPVPEFSVVVDMVTLEVVEVADMPGRSLNR